MNVNRFRKALAIGAVVTLTIPASINVVYATSSLGGITQADTNIGSEQVVKSEELSSNNTDDGKSNTTEKDVENKDIKENVKSDRVSVQNTSVTLMHKEDGIYLVSAENLSGRKLTDSEYIILMDNLGYSIEDDIKSSYESLAEDNLEADHLKLNTWGEFLYLYADKNISSMPTGDYTIRFKENNNSITLKGDRGTRQWIEDDLIPKVRKILVEASNSYVVKVYKYMPISTTYLGDLDYNTLKKTTNLEVDFEVHPFTGEQRGKEDREVSISVHSIGATYGLQLHRDYVSVVNNINTNTGMFIGLEDDNNGCVPKVVSLGILANSEQETITSPRLADYLGIQELAIDLSDNSVVKITSIDGYKFEKLGTLEDFNLTKDTVALKKVSDGYVAVPLLYKEYFQTSERIYPNGFTVDLTPIIFSDTFEVKVGENHSEVLERYVGASGVVDARYDAEIGDFIILNGLGKTHYGRMCAWIWSGQADNYLSDANQIRYLETAEKWYKDNNKKDELKMYTKQYNGYTSAQASGEGLNPVVKIALVGGIIVLVGGGVGLVVMKSSKKKKSEAITKDFSNANTQDLKFGYDDEDEEDGEDNNF